MASHAYASGSGAVSLSIPPMAGTYDNRWALYEVRCHVSAAVVASDDLTVTLDSARGSTYDTVLLTQSMTGATDYVWRPSQPVHLNSGDKLTIAFPNTDANTVGIEAVYRSL